MSHIHLHIDFESRSACDIKACGAEVYARDFTTDILCIGYAFGEAPADYVPFDEVAKPLIYAETMHLIKKHVAKGGKVIAHNAAFELAIWNHVGVRKYGWPELKPEQMECTLSMAYAMALPGSLEKASAAVGIPDGKDMAGSRVMLQLAQPRSIDVGTHTTGYSWYEPHEFPEKFETLYNYCKRDVEVERELYRRLLPLSPQERAVWLLDMRINQRGVAVDAASARKAVAIVKAETARLDAEMREATGNQVATCTAAAQLTQWLKFRGLKLDGVAKADVGALLKTDIPADCRRALELRQEAAKSSTAKLETMLSRACSDGRIRGTLQYHGAATGRWAGRGVQLHNFPRGALNQSEVDGVFDILDTMNMDEGA